MRTALQAADNQNLSDSLDGVYGTLNRPGAIHLAVTDEGHLLRSCDRIADVGRPAGYFGTRLLQNFENASSSS